MKEIWSIRMRASQELRTQKSKVRNQKSKFSEIHISGAEGLYEKTEMQRIVRKYIERALVHSRGEADRIVITVEKLKRIPENIKSLPVTTVSCSTPSQAKKFIVKMLDSLGITRGALDAAFNVIRQGNMSGAAIISAAKAERLEPEIERGVRVSRLGISHSASKMLSSKLAQYNINTDTVKEALILASKVASCRGIIAELCVSDDPNYTTGYIASRTFGYLRIPNIKNKKSKTGGRVFFVRDGQNTANIIHYLENTPVIVKRISACRGTVPIYEILGHHQ